MTSQIIDIIIFGATGYTGQCVVEQCARINNFSWAIAGRNVNKLREVLTNIYTKTGLYYYNYIYNLEMNLIYKK